MLNIVVLIIALLCWPAVIAQTFKCKAPSGNVEYQQSPCRDARDSQVMGGGAISGIDALSKRDIQHARQLAARERADLAASLAAQAEQAAAARAAAARPTDQDVKNAETSASSKTIGTKERLFLQDQAKRLRTAHDGAGSYTEDDLKRLREAGDAQNNLSEQDRKRARSDAEAIHLHFGGPAVRQQIIDAHESEDARVAARRAAAAAAAAESGSRLTQQSGGGPTYDHLQRCSGGMCTGRSGESYQPLVGAPSNLRRADGAECRLGKV